MKHTTVRQDASEPRVGMTLDEMGAFVQEAMRAGAAGSETVKQMANWKGGIRYLTVEISALSPATEPTT